MAEQARLTAEALEARSFSKRSNQNNKSRINTRLTNERKIERDERVATEGDQDIDASSMAGQKQEKAFSVNNGKAGMLG